MCVCGYSAYITCLAVGVGEGGDGVVERDALSLWQEVGDEGGQHGGATQHNVWCPDPQTLLEKK